MTDRQNDTTTKIKESTVRGAQAALGSKARAKSLAFRALLVAVLASAAISSEALAVFGDQFGIAPINTTGTQTSPAYPGTDAFWAGTCDTASAPAFGDPIPGGVGSRPNTILAPDIVNVTQTPVAAPDTPAQCIDWGAPGQYLVSPDVWTEPPAWRLAPVTDAGAHSDGTTSLWLNKIGTPEPGGIGNAVDGNVDNIYVDLPPGFVGNPKAVPECTAEQFAVKPLQCPPESQVGVLQLMIEAAVFGGDNHPVGAYDTAYPVYNLEPRKGNVAELGFGYASGERATTVRLVGKARTNGDFGVTAFAGQIPVSLPAIAQSITLWGVPWAAANDLWRPLQGHVPGTTGCAVQPGTPNVPHYIPPSGLSPACQAGWTPAWGDSPLARSVKPFLTTETDCNPAPTVNVAVDSYQRPGAFTPEGDPATSTDADWETSSSISPTVTDCAGLDFAPDIDFDSTSSLADDATGLDVELSIPQNNDLPFEAPAPGASQGEIDDYLADAAAYWKSDDGRATAHLMDTVVTLPADAAVNPSGAAGLQGCSDAEFGLVQEGPPSRFNNEDPFDDVGSECPDGSVIGTVKVETPLLDEVLDGQIVLGTPKSTDPQSGKMFRVLLVVRNEERGLLAKIYGSATADPNNKGQLTATFLQNPELPFNRLELHFKGGSRGLMRTPQRCGTPQWTSTFTPWSAAHGGGGAPVNDGGGFDISGRCAFPFAPAMKAGMSSRQAGGSGAFSFELTRGDGTQWLRGVTAELPTGLLAAVRDVPLCTNAQANANACPLASRIGSVDGSAGAGDPFVLEQKGSVYLTEGYKGAPYGLAVSVPVEAGPFRGALALDPIVVRQALHVDRTDASVTAVSDPLPIIHHGIPLAVRRVLVTVDRPGFMRNPTNCAGKTIQASLVSAEGATAGVSTPFHASGCANLPFKPKLTLKLTGKKQMRTGKHPGVKAVVTQKGGEAGIGKAVVRLPKSLALDPANAQALCEFEAGTKPDLENHCPKGSIVGRARAVSPLLKRPLAGDVYFVKNVRRSSSGNVIRTLPMIIVALRGEIAVNLKGESSTTNGGKLVNTFANVPDAPISQFNLNIKGGANGILAVTRTRRGLINICRSGKQLAEAEMDGQNGRRHDRSIRLGTPCTKKQKAAKQKAAKRKAAKRKATRN